MSDVFREFCDANMHRAYPLIDSAAGEDKTGTMRLPTSLITDIFMCVPKLPAIDADKFFVSNVLFRRLFIDITIGYDDDGTPVQVGMFKNIRTDAALQTSYDFSPFRIDDGSDIAPVFYSTGQITIGDCAEALKLFGSWSFDPDQTYISPTRISRGVVNVQFISVNNRLFTGDVRFKEGANVTLDVAVAGDVTTVTVNASLTAGEVGSLQLASDEDVLNELIARYGIPVLTLNGMFPDDDRNINFIPEDCTQVDASDHKIVISNTCAKPCCDEDANLDAIKENIANLNLRYAQLKAYFNSQSVAINDMQRNLTVLGSNV